MGTRLVPTLLFTALAAWTLPPAVAAQWNCGSDCGGCGPFPDLYKEAKTSDPFGEFDMECPQLSSSTCSACPLAVSSDAVDQEAIGRAVLTANVSEIPALVTAYGHRLLVSDTRDLIGIQGNACNERALGVWLRVSADKMAAFRTADLQSLDEVLNQRMISSPD